MKHSQDLARLVDVLDGYLNELGTGQPPELEAFLARHPDLAENLRPCLTTLEFIHASPPEDDSAPLHQALGDFEIRREIGRGGMGVVYEAEQLSLGRQVALKVLPFAAVMDPRQLQRFKNEALAAAHLHHTHIVPVYSVGNERGVHYYAMQYIEGSTVAGIIEDLRGGNGKAPSAAVSSITKGKSTQSEAYCRSVARLGIQAAEALDHAHQQGVTHRDIKPANLIIDAHGDLWITDFGLASFTNSPGLTMTGDIVGTVRYMSPEQALAKRVPIDHRTDVYSLGVTLYEFVTLEGAFQGDDAHRVIEEIAFKEPRSARSLNPAVPNELETILMKAMAKSPDDRYETAQAMADDLARYLQDRPIEAKRPGLVKRVQKWARRNRRLVAAGIVMLILAVVGLSIGTVLIAAEEERTGNALKARDIQLARAETSFRKLREAVDEMLTVFGNEELEDIPHMVEMQEKFFLRALAYWEEFLREEGDDPEVRREAGRAHARVGRTQRLLGRRDEAEQSFRRAIALLEDLPATPANRLPLARTYRRLGMVAHDGEASAAFSRAIETLEELGDEFPADRTYRFELAKTLYRRATRIDDTRGARQGAEAFQDVKDRFTKLTEEFPGNARYRKYLAFTCFNLGSCWSGVAGTEVSHKAPAAAEASPELREAETQFTEALELLREFLELDPDDRVVRGTLAGTCDLLSVTYLRLGRQEEAEDCALEAVEARRKLADDYPSIPRYRHLLAMNLSNAYAVVGAAEPVRGAAMLEEAIALEQGLQQMFSQNRHYPHYEAIFWRNLSNPYRELNRFSEADAALRKAISLWDGLTKRRPDKRQYRVEAASAEANRGGVWTKAGDFAKAGEAYAHAVDRLRRVVDESPKPELVKRLATYWSGWGVALFRKGEPDRGIDAFQRATDLDSDNAGAFGNLGQALQQRGQALARKGRRDEAVEHYRDALRALEVWDRKIVGSTEPRFKIATTRYLLATLMPLPKRFKELKRHCRRALDLCEQLAREAPGDPRSHNLQAGLYHALGDGHLANGDPMQARKNYADAVAARKACLELKPGNAAYERFLRNHIEALARATELLKKD